jgi:hypothetical protein
MGSNSSGRSDAIQFIFIMRIYNYIVPSPHPPENKSAPLDPHIPKSQFRNIWPPPPNKDVLLCPSALRRDYANPIGPRSSHRALQFTS